MKERFAFGRLLEYPIARRWADCRLRRLYRGIKEIRNSPPGRYDHPPFILLSPYDRRGVRSRRGPMREFNLLGFAQTLSKFLGQGPDEWLD